MFNGKIAKVGKARYVGCRLNLSNKFDLFLSSESTAHKTLELDGAEYTLSKIKSRFFYNQILPINDNFVVARYGKNFIIENFGENNG